MKKIVWSVAGALIIALVAFWIFKPADLFYSEERKQLIANIEKSSELARAVAEGGDLDEYIKSINQFGLSVQYVDEIEGGKFVYAMERYSTQSIYIDIQDMSSVDKTTAEAIIAHEVCHEIWHRMYYEMKLESDDYAYLNANWEKLANACAQVVYGRDLSRPEMWQIMSQSEQESRRPNQEHIQWTVDKLGELGVNM
jgi:hypothetical protein